MATIAIPINKLDPWPHNVRKTKPSKQEDAELLASIRANGLLKNLVVIPGKKGRFEVVAGDRRRQALLKLVESGDKKPTDTVDCQVRDPEEALELSLIENTHRVAMHPADEFEAYAALIKNERLDEKAIADRFGVPKKHVQQRLKLAQIHPEIIAAFRADKIKYNAVMAFTAAQSQDEQLTLWKDLSKSGDTEDLDGDEIRDELKQDAATADSQLAKFVGLKAYKAAGGSVSEDLFSEAKWLNDVDLLQKLANEKLNGIVDGLLNDGWKWVSGYLKGVPHNDIHYLSRIKATVPAALLKKQESLEEQYNDADEESEELENALDAIKQEISQKTTFSRADMANAGCIVYVDYQGRIEIEKGLIRKSDNPVSCKPEAAKLTSPADDDNGALPAKVAEELRDVRHSIARQQILQHPQLASDLLIYVLCRSALAADHSLSLKIHTTKSGNNLPELPEPDLAWLDDSDDVASWQAFRALSSNDVKHLMAHATARLLSITLANAPGADDVVESVLAEMNIDWPDHYKPTADNYFGRLKKDALLALGEQLFSAEWRKEHENDKRKDLAVALHEQTSQIPGWLPAGIRPEQPTAT